MERDFIQKLTYDKKKKKKMELIQRGHEWTVLISDNAASKTEYIPAGDMVMLINFYRYIKDNDIQNDFINYNGKNWFLSVIRLGGRQGSTPCGGFFAISGNNKIIKEL